MLAIDLSFLAWPQAHGLNLSHQNYSFSPCAALFLRAVIALPEECKEISPSHDQNADVAYHTSWFISATSQLCRYLFFSRASSVHVSRERSFSWPSVPAEKDGLLDASRKLPLPLPNRKRLFFSNMPIIFAKLWVLIMLKFPAIYWYTPNKSRTRAYFLHIFR